MAPFQEDDLLLAEGLVTRAALCLENALQYARERTAALTLQRDLLPQRVRGGAAVEVASRYAPADLDRGVGGDWFDVVELSGARVALVVGDVVGQGIHAAATMGRLRTAMHTLADLEVPQPRGYGNKTPALRRPLTPRVGMRVLREKQLQTTPAVGNLLDALAHRLQTVPLRVVDDTPPLRDLAGIRISDPHTPLGNEPSISSCTFARRARATGRSL